MVHVKTTQTTVVNQLSSGFNPSPKPDFFFQFLDLFRARFFFSDCNCLSFCQFDTQIIYLFSNFLAQVSCSLTLTVCTTCSTGMQCGWSYSFFLSLCLNNHMAAGQVQISAKCILCIQAIRMLLVHRRVRSTFTMVVLHAVSHYPYIELHMTEQNYFW